MMDRYWLDAKTFLKGQLKSGERLIAPPQFGKELFNVYDYACTYDEDLAQFAWAVLHKDQLQKLNPKFLRSALEQWQPVFANEVFVIFSNRPSSPTVELSSANSIHLSAFWSRVTALDPVYFSGLPSGQQLDGPRRLVTRFLAQFNALLQRLAALELQVSQLQRQGERQHSLSGGKAIAKMSLPQFREVCRAACHSAYLGDNTILCRVLGRCFLYGDTQDVAIVPEFCMNGYWEPSITLAMARAVQSGWCCVDVGANHGYYSLLLASIVEATGRVLAVEPNPRLVELMRRSFEANGFQKQATALQTALFERSGETLRLIIPQGRGMNASLFRAETAADATLEVQTTTLDDLTADWPRVDFIKIDAEGAEESIWRGMTETLRRNPDLVIMLEFNCARYADPAAFLQTILDSGFVLRHVASKAVIQDLTVDQCLTERPDTDWMLFLRRY